ncbi:MAG: DinB family protein [Anaerolineales bacterium]
MNPNRKHWNEQLKLLRWALKDSGDHRTAIDLFLGQHAMVHDAEMSNAGLHSFADEVWDGASEATLRCVPPKFEHSIAWIIWHMARIEDMTMNGLLAGKKQVFFQDNWPIELKIDLRHSGNVVMDDADVTELSQVIDIDALKAYRLAVGRSTQEVVKALEADYLECNVEPARLQELLENGSVVEEARDLLTYWGNLTIAGLLLMPPTRHNFVHLNEASRIKKKCQ